jgi:predicted nucleic acid-binding protein
VILVDSNVFMYSAGADHPHKEPCSRFLTRIAEDAIDAAVDAEVLQEILHRYRATMRWEDGRRVYDLARRIVPVVLPVTAEVLDAARLLMDSHPGFWARDALHAAVVIHHQLEAIVSLDRDFDVVPGIARLEPKELI